MKKLSASIFALFFCFLAISVHGQGRLYFCSSYTDDGEPVGTSSAWNIKSSGGAVYMLYKQSYSLNTDTIYVFIDKMTNGTYTDYASKLFTPSRYKNWGVYDYTFYTAGEYKVRFLDARLNTLATEYLTINLKDNTSSSSSSSSGGNSYALTGTGDYAGSKISFCENIDNGFPKGIYETFNIGSSGGYVNVYVNCPNELRSHGLIVDIWKSNNGTFDFVETKNYDIEPSWKTTYFKYTFYTPGYYRFSVYNKESKLVSEGYVTINSK
jgi:hypothetical protein